ncbi:MAG TPA: hypothetical protein VIJ79_04160 [Acidobacteriaceae bacterium]
MVQETAAAHQIDTDSEQREADYDAWFRQQVEERIREADDPNTVWVSHEQVMQDLDDIIARHRAKQRDISRHSQR